MSETRELMPPETAAPSTMEKAEKLVYEWNFSKTELDNGLTAYMKPVFTGNANLNSLIFLFPFGEPSFDALMMEIVAYLPLAVPAEKRQVVADFVARMALSTVCFIQIDMNSGIVNVKQRVFLQGNLFTRELMARIGDQVYGEADVILQVLNRMVCTGLSPEEAKAEVDTSLGY